MISDGSRSVLLREITVLTTLAKPVTLNVDISYFDGRYLLELEKLDLLIERFQQHINHQQMDASTSWYCQTRPSFVSAGKTRLAVIPESLLQPTRI